MQIYIGLDDTDTLESPIGTGKLARWMIPELPDGCRCNGVVRQQLLVCPDIPYTSHNSAACLLMEISGPEVVPLVIDRATRHIVKHAAPGSDPGLCVVCESDPDLSALMAFGKACTHQVCSRDQALQAAGAAHLSGHGGTNDGIIGAAAAVGLTAAGWLGRYIEMDGLRDYPQQMSVAELNARGIVVVSVDRDAPAPAPGDMVETNGWLRPLRMAHGPVLMVQCKEAGLWQNIHSKKKRTGANPIERGRPARTAFTGTDVTASIC
jgi:tRNA(Ile2) C34 agmatinyltransferase TiaS